LAYTRYQVVTTSVQQHKVFRWSSRHPVIANLLPWTIGMFFTMLYFVDLADFTWKWQAFFDPVSKITILLPPENSYQINFYIQTAFSAVVSLLTVWYSIRAWVAINENAESVRRKGMIT
jgi:hypothetical protein